MAGTATSPIKAGPNGILKVLLSLAAVFLTIGLAWHVHRPAPPAPVATWSDVESQAKQGGYRLLTTADLAERYRQNRDKLLIIDTRQEWEYHTGHIDGALNFPLEPTWWAAWRARGELAKLLGPDKNRFIVFY